MKKILLLSAVLSASLYAKLSDADILSMYAGIPQDVKAEVASREAVNGLDGIEAVTIKFSQGDDSQEDVIFTQGDLVLMDIIDPKKKIMYKQVIQDVKMSKNLAATYSKEDANNIIKLGSDKNKPTMVVFTDAECPFCRQELKNIENRLKDNNIEIIMTSVHAKSGHSKSAMIYKDIKNAKTDAEKIAILRKYYDEKLGSQELQAGDNAIASAKALADKYFKSGLRSVPYIIEKNKLVK